MTPTFSDLQRDLRRWKTFGHKGLTRRTATELKFLDAEAVGPQLLLDTTVSIDNLQRHLPPIVKQELRLRHVWHSTVVEAELAVLLGALDPLHAGSMSITRKVLEVIDRLPEHRMVTPDRQGVARCRGDGWVPGAVAKVWKDRTAASAE